MKNDTVLGFRCSAKDFSFAVLKGTPSKPEVLERSMKKFPTGLATPERLCWFHKEVHTILSKHNPRFVVVKADESTTKSTSALERAYIEALYFYPPEN